ncbi:MAG: M42 family peptidase, partial [Oscillospiraceae bacterium]
EEGTPPCNVAFLLSDQEELGCRGAKTASFSIEPQEAIVVDVSFGDTPDIPSYKTGKLGDGAMIGISPILSPKISNRLKNLGQSLEIPFQPEVMGGATSTNADVISISKDGIPCGLISIPLRNMHTPAEVISIEDVKSVAKLLAAYVLSYGKENGHD